MTFLGVNGKSSLTNGYFLNATERCSSADYSTAFCSSLSLVNLNYPFNKQRQSYINLKKDFSNIYKTKYRLNTAFHLIVRGCIFVYNRIMKNEIFKRETERKVVYSDSYDNEAFIDEKIISGSSFAHTPTPKSKKTEVIFPWERSSAKMQIR